VACLGGLEAPIPAVFDHFELQLVQMVVTTFNTSIPSASRYSKGGRLPISSLDTICCL
jgi:hypothetical protein